MPWKNKKKKKKNHPSSIIEDLKGISPGEFLELLANSQKDLKSYQEVKEAVSIFGSARLKPDHPYYIKSVELCYTT